MSVAAVLPALSLEACSRIAPVPQSKLTTERHGGEDQQMVVVYRQDNDGCGDTWCQVWATDGNYSLEIVDEAPLTSMSFDDVLRPSATVVFGRGEASIDDDAGRVLDSIANWLEVHPDVPAEIRGHRGPLEVPAPRGERAKAVLDGLAAHGISAERFQVSESDLSDAGFEVTVEAVAS